MTVWICPYCGQKADVEGGGHRAEREVAFGSNRMASIRVTGCPNPDCRHLELTAFLDQVEKVSLGGGTYNKLVKRLNFWQLVPTSRARVWPEYVTGSIVQDYQEACLIEQLSPKGSAALSRRCLQALIRDFFHISKSRLIDEIKELEDRAAADIMVSPELLEALHAIRSIGNIGAHPERDPSIVVDVEPGEATAMIDLLELLIEETYLAQHDRQTKIELAKQIAVAKEAAKKPPTKT
ncbi:MAG: DUF4145 domain-containing protein [Candidatus Cybelea sp.]